MRGDKKLTVSRRQRGPILSARIGLVLVAVAADGGCGNSFDDTSGRILFVADCDGIADTATGTTDAITGELVALDWSGGVTPLFPGHDFDPLDLSAFHLADGGSLADDPERFKEQVRRLVTRILCDSPGPKVHVLHAGETEQAGGTTVHFTQDLSPDGGMVIGEGDYDPCNRQHDNVAVIFGEQVRRLAAESTFDGWVRAFANVTAHEIAHTLGFAHVDRQTQWPVERALFVELMLDGHTIDELQREQTFVVDQNYCPDDWYRLRRPDEYTTVTCGLAH